MSIGTEIIQDALKQINVHSVVSPANPESIEDGRKAVNSMLEMWLSEGIRLGFTPLEVPGDDLNEPADARNGIVSNLAIVMSPMFDGGKPVVSQELKSQARIGLVRIKRLYRSVTIPNKVVSSTLPKGQGNRRWIYRDTFFNEGETIDG